MAFGGDRALSCGGRRCGRSERGDGERRVVRHGGRVGWGRRLGRCGHRAGSVRIAARMRSTLSRGPWIACPTVALPVGTGAPRIVLRAPGSSDFLALTVVAVRQRYHLVVPEGSGVLWWCGDPRQGGVVAQPGGEILAWARPTRRGRRREGDAQRAVSSGLLNWAAPRQPQANSATREVIATPPRRKPLFRWIALLAVLVMGLGIAGSLAAERDSQVDLTVVQEDARGNCSVTWRDPWSGAARHGPFRCDPGRDPLLNEWETGFVVSYGPWKGDLYNADLEGTPANAVNDGLFLTGLLGLTGSGIGGGIRTARRVTERRTAWRGGESGSLPGDGVPRVVLTKDSSADAQELTDLSYAAWTEPVRRAARPSSESTSRPEADGIKGMPGIWIGLDVAARRRNWWWTGFLTLVCVGAAVAVALSEGAGDRWWWVGGVGVFWLVGFFYMINRGYGRTLLTSNGMEFRTFVGRRSVPWTEIARIEKRRHQARSGEWWDVCVVRVRGRSLTVPGVFTSSRWDADCEEKLAVIREYWSRAVVG